MNDAAAEKAILLAWKAGWEAIHPSDTPWTPENEVFDSAPQWARITIVQTSSRQVSIGVPGARRFERRGRIAVQLFVDINQGKSPLTALVGDVRTVLEGASIFAAGDPQAICVYAVQSDEATTDGRWFQQNAQAPCVWYETR